MIHTTPVLVRDGKWIDDTIMMVPQHWWCHGAVEIVVEIQWRPIVFLKM